MANAYKQLEPLPALFVGKDKEDNNHFQHLQGNQTLKIHLRMA